jgi:hypothetical protein
MRVRKHNHSKTNAIAKEAATVAVKIVATFIFLTSLGCSTLFTHGETVSGPGPRLKLKDLAEIPQPMYWAS